MVTTYAVTHGRQMPAISRVASILSRNVAALRSGPSYWLVLLSGFFEPMLYLLSIGVGVGALIGNISVGDKTLSYAAFVAPAMLAVSAMSGALAETTYNFFAKFKFVRSYDSILATPLKPMDIAAGELVWAMLRGSLYTVCFLIIMVALDLTTPLWALATLPATMLVGLAFGSIGMAISTMIRGWQDFDLVHVGQFSMFLFSGTFSPVQDYPFAVEILIALTPLYHAVEVLRALSTGAPSLGMLVSIAYLALTTLAGLMVASRRMSKALLA